MQQFRRPYVIAVVCTWMNSLSWRHQCPYVHCDEHLQTSGCCLDWHFPSYSSECIYLKMWTHSEFNDSEELIFPGGKEGAAIPTFFFFFVFWLQTDLIAATLSVTIHIPPQWLAQDLPLGSETARQSPHLLSCSSNLVSPTPLAHFTGWVTGMDTFKKSANMEVVSVKLTEKTGKNEGLGSIQGP